MINAWMNIGTEIQIKMDRSYYICKVCHSVHHHTFQINQPTYLLTPWSRVLLEKLTVNFAASQEIPAFMELESSSPYQQVPAIYGCVILPLETLPPRRSEWDCFVSRGSISTWVIFNILFLWRGVVSTSPNPQESTN
jgi:hypothetical protein